MLPSVSLKNVVCFSIICSIEATTFLCVRQTPFGKPVVPLECEMNARDSSAIIEGTVLGLLVTANLLTKSFKLIISLGRFVLLFSSNLIDNILKFGGNNLAVLRLSTAFITSCTFSENVMTFLAPEFFI